jgi:hypothetical protein
MKERIEELAELAGYQPEVFEICKLCMEKFAELIIKECANVCKETAEKQFSPLYSRESDGAIVCFSNINKHFGIK